MHGTEEGKQESNKRAERERVCGVVWTVESVAVCCNEGFLG